MSKASSKAMEALHGALAKTFTDILEKGEVVVDRETGEGMRVTPGASMLSAVRQFLKDNGIESAAGTDPTLNGLARTVDLPFPTKTDDFGPH